MDDRASGHWPDLRPLVRRELDTYLAAVPRLQPDLPTRCPPWTVRDLTRHLAATFERYAALLARGRRGDVTPLDAENLRAVRELTGDPEPRLRAAADGFLTHAHDPDESMPHQSGPRPVGVQLAFALREVTVHHDDAAAAAGGGYRPPEDVVDALVAFYRRLGTWDEGQPPGWETSVRGRGS